MEADLPAMRSLLLADAQARAAVDAALWPVAETAAEKIAAALRPVLSGAELPFYQSWLVAEAGGAICGLAHGILLPVPPIYAGAFGPPGLIMEDCYVAPDAPEGTDAALLAAAEADLIAAGAQILLTSSVTGGAWEPAIAARGYVPLTAYLARSGLRAPEPAPELRPARAEDVPAIVGLSAEHRQVLVDLEPFWEPHPEADPRFGAWMTKSLSLTDRDMVVTGAEEVVGYAISHPATPLHFPPAHDITAIGVIDDYYHREFHDPAARQGTGAAALLRAAEAARQARGGAAVLVVCPSDWASKIAVLEGEGYRTAITWHIRRPG